MNRFNVSVRKIGKKIGNETTRTAQRNQSAAFVGFGDEWDQLEVPDIKLGKSSGMINRSFEQRHIGPGLGEQREMMKTVGVGSMEELIENTVPNQIRHLEELRISDPISENEMRARFEEAAKMNDDAKSFIGLGYHNCHTPAPILRDVLMNPGWHTQYSPYQAEISQGRLESLLNFQTMVTDLTGLDVANSSLLDEATAGCEAVTLMINASKKNRNVILLDEKLHPQTITCIKTRTQFHNIKIEVCSKDEMVEKMNSKLVGIVTQYPNTEGNIIDMTGLVEATHENGGLVSVASDLLALSMIKPPGEYGADVCFGSSQRLGIPMYLGGPAAAFFVAKKKFQRQVPGRIVGVSVDADGKKAYRLALQAREQHIRREKATSNVCTAQALLANGAAMWGIYHGPEGMTEIAEGVHHAAVVVAHGIKLAGYKVTNEAFFDTLKIDVGYDKEFVLSKACSMGINLRNYPGENCVGVALDDTVTTEDIDTILSSFGCPIAVDDFNEVDLDECERLTIQNHDGLTRKSEFMTHENFKKIRSELELVRYIKELERTDLSMVHSMIPLGSCTMKLNAASELEYLAMPEFAGSHPFAPTEQMRGWNMIFHELERDLAEITGYDKVSLQPNSGAQGEFAGLAAISAYHQSRGDTDRKNCLIPTSAHGTNPASAAMAGLNVRAVKVNPDGSINLNSLKENLAKYSDSINSIMVTYPSTFGVFDEDISEICGLVHEQGGQVYLDGANMNAQSGLCRPGKYGADVSHLNLHKTFAIPHGGGGPGAGPIGVRAHLAPFLPSHPVMPFHNHDTALGTISAAPYGNAGVLPISWAYIKMLGSHGVKKASEVAILNANYMRCRLEGHYNILYIGSKGNCAHEFIIDIRPFKKTAGISAVDVAKRLMDYGFHAPTMSWPVADTLMIEPTESESKSELDRYVDALIHIRNEIGEIESGKYSKTDNVLKNAPHTMSHMVADEWQRPYSRTQACFPSHHQTPANKFWPLVSRINDKYGDTNLVCTCPPMETYL